MCIEDIAIFTFLHVQQSGWTCPFKQLQHTTVGARALSTCCFFPGFAASPLSVLTYVQCNPMGLTLPLPCAHWALWVEQGDITCAIFHVRSCPRYASRTSKCRVPSQSNAWMFDILFSSAQWNFNLNWFRHNNELKHEGFTALCHLDNLCKQL